MINSKRPYELMDTINARLKTTDFHSSKFIYVKGIDDATSMIFESAIAMEIEEYTCVFSEHLRPVAFPRDEYLVYQLEQKYEEIPEYKKWTGEEILKREG